MLHKRYKKGIFTIVHWRYNDLLRPDSFDLEYRDSSGEMHSYMVLPPLRIRDEHKDLYLIDTKNREYTYEEYDEMISRTIKIFKIKTNNSSDLST